MAGTDSAFDAVLIIAFGGPGKHEDIRPFIANVLRGRRVSPERVEEVVHHYELFNGYSPLTDITMRQAKGLESRLRANGIALPVFVGMRNWHPYLADTLSEMSRKGFRRVIGFLAAAQHSYSSCQQYKENLRDAREAVRSAGLPDVEITFVPSWYNHPLFIEANADNIRQAREKLSPELRNHARVIFTSHSIPLEMARNCRYGEQLMTTARAIAERLSIDDFALVYQSRSGRPQDPWLEPDICDYLREQAARGLRAAIIAPIGFICDHIEVLYDLDHEAAAVCSEVGIEMSRAETVNDHKNFLDMMSDVVTQTWNRYQKYPVLPITVAGV